VGHCSTHGKSSAITTTAVLHRVHSNACLPPACLPAACVAGWMTNERTFVKFGSTWKYNWANQPTAYNSADQCDLCHDGSTLAVFRTDTEKKDIVDTWAFSLSRQAFWFGYSMEPGTIHICIWSHAWACTIGMVCCGVTPCRALHGCPVSCI
jgi:hypothetical protein